MFEGGKIESDHLTNGGNAEKLAAAVKATCQVRSIDGSSLQTQLYAYCNNPSSGSAILTAMCVGMQALKPGILLNITERGILAQLV